MVVLQSAHKASPTASIPVQMESEGCLALPVGVGGALHTQSFLLKQTRKPAYATGQHYAKDTWYNVCAAYIPVKEDMAVSCPASASSGPCRAGSLQVLCHMVL